MSNGEKGKIHEEKITHKDGGKKPEPELDSIKTQYNRISEDWRQYNNILWGIPAVAVSIMAGIIVAAYQPSLVGLPRFVLLAIGSLLLYALTAEAVKKQLYMNINLRISKKLQDALRLQDFETPASTVEKYWKDERNEKFKTAESGVYWLSRLLFENRLYRKIFESSVGASRILAGVVFLAAISVGILAALDLIGIVIRFYHIPLGFELP